MANSKLVLATGLAAATLVLVLVFGIGGPAVIGNVANATVIIIIAIALAAAAFVVSWKQKSFSVAGLLAASGIIFMVPPVTALGDFSVIVFPGPIIGVIFGLVIFGLGVAKGIMSAMASTPRATTVR
ncbi:MAG: hypothetical protein ACREAY_08185 [Nitrososphaera sp.]|uniref:hypothetical protein n=1 Tax=Nitrososphaera sp. TaxID=1971748 RepID=UPI003D6F5F5F